MKYLTTTEERKKLNTKDTMEHEGLKEFNKNPYWLFIGA
jgi:hypothetical protein